MIDAPAFLRRSRALLVTHRGADVVANRARARGSRRELCYPIRALGGRARGLHFMQSNARNDDTAEAYELDESGIRVVGRIGTGAMASVLRARMPDGRPTAVKLLMPRHMANPEVAERFVVEGDLMRAVRSPHIPEIYATGTTESGQPYYPMELLEGVDLECLLETSRVPVVDAIRYGLDACAAVTAVHDAGILHRDVKPANLFLAHRPDRPPTVVLLDFGIAKRIDGAARSHETTAGLVVGTPSYMSPEQVRGAAAIDARSDVWALGTVIYELLSGRAPYAREHVAETLQALLYAPPPPLRDTLGEAPPGLEGVLVRCLEKEPALRYASARELAAALEPLLALAARSRHHSGIERRTRASAPPSGPTSATETLVEDTSTDAGEPYDD